MILAAGLSPAWQQILAFDRFRVGEVNRAVEAHACASGKVINVGRALFELRAEAQTLTVIGGTAGEAIRREFEADQISAAWISCDVPTRTCTTILERSSGVTTELVENTSPISACTLGEFQSAFQRHAAAADVVVITGSSPPGTPATMYRDLLANVSARSVLDIRGEELLAALDARPFVIKPNRDELSATVGRELASDDDLLQAMRELNARGAKWVVVTDGAGPVWMTSADETFRCQPPEVELVNPIGCGDCFAAGVAWGIMQGRSPADWLKLGVAAAADNAVQLLPARLDASRVGSSAESIAFV